MKKRSILFLIVIFLSSNLIYSKTGLLHKQDKIYYLETNYFYIIYPEKSRIAATKLFEKADLIFEEICNDFYELKIRKIPVVISPETENFNAYYTDYNYPHIVLYETFPSEDFSVYEDILLGTFKHELTHLVSLNVKNKFYLGLHKIFGSILNPGNYIVFPTLIKEGATVLEESKNKDGRLNDPFFLHTVRQAKLMEFFPNADDVTGANQKYPGGSAAYSFGACFAEYLQKKYGMEKYAEYFYNGNNFAASTYKRVFKKTYKKSFNKEWKEFEKSIFLPKVEKEILKENISKDFFNEVQDKESEKFSIENNSEGLYTNLCSFQNGFIYFDGRSDSIYLSKKNENNSFNKPKKIISFPNISDVKISFDGKFLAIKKYNINNVNIKSTLSIYSMEDKNIFETKLNNVLEACITENNGDYYLLTLSYENLRNKIQTYKILFNEKKSISKIEKLDEFLLEEYISLHSLNGGKNGNIFAIKKEKLNWEIINFNISSLNKNNFSYKTYSLPDKDLRIRNLSINYDENNSLNLAFSFAKYDTFPRLGIIIIENEEMINLSLMSKDISGGIYYPLIFDEKIIYSGYFYYDFKLLSSSLEKLKVENFSIQTENRQWKKKDLEMNINPEEKKYHPFLIKQGTFIPLSTAPIYNFIESELIQSLNFIPGLTFMFNNPWDADHVIFTGSYNPNRKTFAFATNIFGMSQTSIYNYQISPSFIFNTEDFFQANNSFIFSSGFRIGKHSSLSFIEENIFIYGNFYQGEGILNKNENIFDKNKLLILNNRFTIQFSTLHLAGRGEYEFSGLAFNLTYQNQFLCSPEKITNPTILSFTEGTKIKEYLHLLSPKLTIRIPKLIPIDCYRNFTYNLPSIIETSLYNDFDNFLNFKFSLLVFDYQIQKGLPFLPLFFSNIQLYASYTYNKNKNSINTSFNDVKNDFINFTKLENENTISLNLIFEPIYNSGALANPNFALNLGLCIDYNFEKNKFYFSIASSTLF